MEKYVVYDARCTERRYLSIDGEKSWTYNPDNASQFDSYQHASKVAFNHEAVTDLQEARLIYVMDS